MDTKEIIKSWRWRIIRAGFTIDKFCNSIGVAKSSMSQYLNGKVTPSLGTYDVIENKLKSLEKEKDDKSV